MKPVTQFAQMTAFAACLGDTKGVLDSASESEMPESVGNLVDALPATFDTPRGTKSVKNSISAALFDGIADYEKAHGRKPDGALLESAVRSAYASNTAEGRKKHNVPSVMDDAVTSASGAPMAVNRVIVAIRQTLVEACPVAGYVPFDNGLESRLVIVSHNANSASGAYAVGDNLDGVNSGKPFMMSEREVAATGSGATWSATIKHANADAAGSPTIAGSVQVLVNGLRAGGTDIRLGNSEPSAQISGSITIAGVAYTAGGTLTSATGAVAITFSPALPAGNNVSVIGHINYEHATMKTKTPQVQVDAKMFPIRAYSTRGVYQLTQDARQQFATEVRLDSGTEAMVALRTQSNNERHVRMLNRLYTIGKNYITPMSFNAPTRQDQRERASIWQDLAMAISVAEKDMALRTFGLTVRAIYVGKVVAGEIAALPSTIFTSAGTPPSDGIYRVGTLFGQYQVYYMPNLLTEGTNSAHLLLVGGASDTARNPLIFGDVAVPTVIPLGAGISLDEGMGYFQSVATDVNPYAPSASGAAVIALTNM